jgi:hypothetical protein
MDTMGNPWGMAMGQLGGMAKKKHMSARFVREFGGDPQSGEIKLISDELDDISVRLSRLYLPEQSGKAAGLSSDLKSILHSRMRRSKKQKATIKKSYKKTGESIANKTLKVAGAPR